MHREDQYNIALKKAATTPFSGDSVQAASLLKDLACAIAGLFPEAAAYLGDSDSAFQRLENGAATGTPREGKVIDVLRQTHERLQHLYLPNDGKPDVKNENLMMVCSLLIGMENSIFVLLSKNNRDTLKRQPNHQVHVSQATSERACLIRRLRHLHIVPHLFFPGTMSFLQQQRSYVRQVLAVLIAVDRNAFDAIMKQPFLWKNLELRNLLLWNAVVLQHHQDPTRILEMSIRADELRSNEIIQSLIDQSEETRYVSIMGLQAGALHPKVRAYILDLPEIDGEGQLRRFQLVKRMSDKRTEKTEKLLFETIHAYNTFLFLLGRSPGMTGGNVV